MRLHVLVYSPAALTLALLLFSKKSWPPYLMLILFPLCLMVSAGAHRGLRAAGFAFFSVLSVFVHSLWATVFRQALAPEIHSQLVAGRPGAWLLIVFQVLLVAGYAVLLVESTIQIVRARQLSGPSASQA